MDDALYVRLMHNFGAAMRSLDPIRFRFYAEFGLTMPQVRVLFILAEEGDQTTGDLAERLNVSPPTMTGIADRLVRQGLIERTSDPADRRVVRLTLSPEGVRVTAEHSEAGRAYLTAILDAMPREQVEALTDALEAFVAAHERTRLGRQEVTP